MMVKFCRTLLLLLCLLLPMERMMVSGLLLLKKQKWWCLWRTERRRGGFEVFYASVGRRRTKREETQKPKPKPLRDDEVNDVGRDERLRRLNHLPLRPWSSRRTEAMTTRATTARTTKRTTTKIVANLRISPRLLKNIKHFSNRRTCEFRVGSFNDHLRIYCSTCCVHDKYQKQIPQSNYYLVYYGYRYYYSYYYYYSRKSGLLVLFGSSKPNSVNDLSFDRHPGFDFTFISKNTPLSKNTSISFLASVLNFFIAAPSSPTTIPTCDCLST